MVRTEPAIYEATMTELLELIRALPPQVESVLLVGHNPGFHEIAVSLCGGGEDDALADLRAKYPTGAMVSLTVDGEWSHADVGCGRLVSFVRPRDLEH
jgi:phosphohistidine phosphatase